MDKSYDLDILVRREEQRRIPECAREDMSEAMRSVVAATRGRMAQAFKDHGPVAARRKHA